ncbi:metalloproteinase inhibitor 1-like isoform X2 [Pleurodeles waltl]|uniref:metalloproteinase inhibitor 1-like isoform X2 n=1 Tax=Pleurodeles waltl TaxID=8319 RepID=UPI0037098FF7
MDARMRLLLLMTLMSISAYQFTNCCTCSPNHAQKAFCNSDLVIRAKFLNDSSTDMFSESFGNYSLIKYEIQTLEVFKGAAELQNLMFIYSSMEFYCGHDISPSNYNKEYLITGPSWNGRVDVNLCNYLVPWQTLSEAQKKGIEGAYNCDCKICSQWECREDPYNYCRLNGDSPWDFYPDPQLDGLELNDQMCALDMNGECTWQPVDT